MGNMASEATTMSGRRIVKQLKQTFLQNKVLKESDYVIINTVSNGYGFYTTTFEEYSNFRYEGASTIFGPYQLNAYIQEFDKLANAISKNEKVPAGPPPPPKSPMVDILKFRFPKLPDSIKEDYGKVILQPNASYKAGDMVKVVFNGAYLNNNFQNVETYLKVQRMDGVTGSWTDYRTDASFDTTIKWAMENDISTVTITWDTTNCLEGTYKIYHTGFKKYLLKYYQYDGTTNQFTLQKSSIKKDEF
jgi:neutral ceramidase